MKARVPGGDATSMETMHMPPDTHARPAAVGAGEQQEVSGVVLGAPGSRARAFVQRGGRTAVRHLQHLHDHDLATITSGIALADLAAAEATVRG